MPQYNNQMTVKINKGYSWLDYEDVRTACQKLNGAALKLYIYFCSYEDGDEVFFSPQQVGREVGLGVSSVRNAFNELARENFIMLVSDHVYVFSGKQKM